MGSNQGKRVDGGCVSVAFRMWVSWGKDGWGKKDFFCSMSLFFRNFAFPIYYKIEYKMLKMNFRFLIPEPFFV